MLDTRRMLLVALLSIVCGLGACSDDAAPAPSTPSASETPSVSSTPPPSSAPTDTPFRRDAVDIHPELPTGQDTPEGAACDFIRSFIANDAALCRERCVAPFGFNQENRGHYETFLKLLADQFDQVRLSPTPDGRLPVSVAALYKAVHPPDSLVSAAVNTYGFKDMMYVDIDANCGDGQVREMRFVVLLDVLDKWSVHPSPPSYPSISAGLSEIPRSTVPWTKPTRP